MRLPLSILDLAPIGSGSTATAALRNSLELAQLADGLGFARYWFAEHHGMPSIASSAPEILIAHVAAATGRIRVGSGGIMLPNHVPLQVAERFHTLEALHPGRIDLGIGRAPGTDPATVRALRPFDASRFAEQLREMLSLSRRDFPADHPFHAVRVIPDDVRLPPIWLLGSSGASAELAGLLGTGYAFASHFSPTPPGPAIRAYHQNFQPSGRFPRPHVLLALSVVCADTEEEARYLASSLDLAWVRLHRGEFAPLARPEEALRYSYTPQELEVVGRSRELHIVGSRGSVSDRIQQLAEESGADELMVTTMIHSHEDRLRSYEFLASAFELGRPSVR
jgi:luciferase family oxidoreductase group 1